MITHGSFFFLFYFLSNLAYFGYSQVVDCPQGYKRLNATFCQGKTFVAFVLSNFSDLKLFVFLYLIGIREIHLTLPFYLEKDKILPKSNKDYMIIRSKNNFNCIICMIINKYLYIILFVLVQYEFLQPLAVAKDVHIQPNLKS